MCVCLRVYLHGECVRERRNTLQGLISAAAATSPHRDAGRDEEMVRLPRQLPPDLHQSVPRLAAAARINLQPPAHWWRGTDTVLILYLSPQASLSGEVGGKDRRLPSRPSLDFGESAGRQWASCKGEMKGSGRM